MVITASLLATELLAQVAIYIAKGVEEVGKRSFGDVYDKIKSLLVRKGEEKAVEDFEADPAANDSALREQIAALLDADVSLRAEVEKGLRAEGVSFAGSVNVGSITQGDNSKVANVHNAHTINM